MLHESLCRFYTHAALVALASGSLAHAKALVTVHNRTEGMLAIGQPKDSQEGMSDAPGPWRLLGPGDLGAFAIPDCQADCEADLAVRRLPVGHTIQFEGLAIQALATDHATAPVVICPRGGEAAPER